MRARNTGINHGFSVPRWDHR
jgi:putative transposase